MILVTALDYRTLWRKRNFWFDWALAILSLIFSGLDLYYVRDGPFPILDMANGLVTYLKAKMAGVKQDDKNSAIDLELKAIKRQQSRRTRVRPNRFRPKRFRPNRVKPKRG